jgi:hypothetical protein
MRRGLGAAASRSSRANARTCPQRLNSRWKAPAQRLLHTWGVCGGYPAATARGQMPHVLWGSAWCGQEAGYLVHPHESQAFQMFGDSRLACASTNTSAGLVPSAGPTGQCPHLSRAVQPTQPRVATPYESCLCCRCRPCRQCACEPAALQPSANPVSPCGGCQHATSVPSQNKSVHYMICEEFHWKWKVPCVSVMRMPCS